MKKNVFILLFLLLFPTIVLAKDTCNSNDIVIKSIVLKDTNGFVEEKDNSSINNNTINLNLKMYDVGDSSTYNITIENNSNEEYYFTKDSFKMDTDYLEYSLVNSSEVIPAKSEKAIELRVTYKNKIPNESYSDTNKIIISLSDKPLENPKTYSNNYIILVLLVILIPISIKYHKKGLLILSIFGIVSNVYAVCTVNINVETKIEIDEREAIFLPGSEVNIKMKELAGDDTSTVTTGYSFQDENIMSIKHSESEPTNFNKENKNIVSTSDSPYPIYMWYEDNTIYWWSEDIHPSLNEDATRMFIYMDNLNDIKSLTFWDTSNVTSMGVMFAYNSSLQSLNGLDSWNTSNVTIMTGMFAYNSSLQSLESLKKWNTSKVTSMNSMFTVNSSLQSLNGLENWDISNLTNMALMFNQNSSLQSLEALKNWDTSKVTTMNNLFSQDSLVQSLEPLSTWDTAMVNTMIGTFYGNNSLKRITGLENWNTSKVTNMRYMFSNCKSLINLNGLEKWKVDNVNNMTYMFSYNSNLTDASAVNDWSISSATTFTGIFYYTPTHPEFTKITGTWSNGTFTPTP